MGVCRSAGKGRGGRRAAVEGAAGAASRDCAGDALWMLRRARSHCVDANISTSMTSSPKLQVPKQSLAAYTGRAEPYRQTWGRAASNTKSQVCTPSGLRNACADVACPLSLSVCPRHASAVHLLLLAAAISLNSSTLLSCIAPPSARHKTLRAHGLAIHPSPGTCLICQTVPSSVTAELHRSQALETNTRICCDRRLILT